ncbi:hypothetical protein PT974_02790 [Cladobotryum mycophilum]|uniref:Uncharacterized protein n=1 Tax=Cladobotryum mycophilum TaxID=491253 RepID=A0ABR0SZ78_9HYPO
MTTDKSRLDRVYAELLQHHPYGWALYKKVTRREIFPGSCGYFDPDGDWHMLLDLTDPDNLDDHGWTIPGDGIHVTESPESMTWGPKTSLSVQSHGAGGAAGATVAAVPIKASVRMSFESKNDVGAVLTTESPVWKHQMGHESSAVQWMANNTPEVIRRYRSIIKRHGIWIVTKTYSTRRCGIAIMTGKSSTVEIGLEAGVQGVSTLAPKSSWSRSTGSSCMELHEDEDGVVVFISGIYFSQKLFGSKLSHTRDQPQQKDKMFRGHGGGDDDDDNNNNDNDESENALGSEDGGEHMELDVECYPSHDDSGSEYESESE